MYASALLWTLNEALVRFCGTGSLSKSFSSAEYLGWGHPRKKKVDRLRKKEKKKKSQGKTLVTTDWRGRNEDTRG